MRFPGRSVRLRLTLLYGALFLASGTALLAITYLLVANQTGQIPFAGRSLSHGGDPTPAGPFQDPAQVQQRLDERTADLLRQLLGQSGIALAIMTVLAVGLGWLMAGRVLRPLRTITTTAREISAGNLHRRLALRGPADELKELGDTIDALLARLEAAFDAQRHFAANASHELRTPLTRVRTLVEVSLADPEPTVASLQRVCERVLVAGRQQERLIESLLTLARSERGIEQWERLDLGRITHEALRNLPARGGEAGLHVEARLDDAPAWGDARLVERLIANLLDNAVRHNMPNGAIQVAAGMRHGRAMLTVSNTGLAIAPHEITRLLRPFQRLGRDRTASRDGHGLGLAIVHAIAISHGAELTAAPMAGGGLTVEVLFPPVLKRLVHRTMVE
ncbi:sensor histidine kinase [Streptomyces sp. NPDC059835]|uniref:sensor histidine kinase n=1 Tax=Streptomyces sp. NPDC059835 TaxID=3346967 RepID=UPI00364B2B60